LTYRESLTLIPSLPKKTRTPKRFNKKKTMHKRRNSKALRRNSSSTSLMSNLILTLSKQEEMYLNMMMELMLLTSTQLRSNMWSFKLERLTNSPFPPEFANSWPKTEESFLERESTDQFKPEELSSQLEQMSTRVTSYRKQQSRER
jgi:hypothetical protein